MTPQLSTPAERTSALARAFDTLAAQYDTAWTNSFLGGLQRRHVRRELLATFRSGDRILELGCGTGADAVFLAENGIEVHALDVSPEMVRTAQHRIERNRLTQQVVCELRAVEQLSGIEDRGPFDGVFSNFGAFNCVRDLHAAASDLSRLLRPGGRLVLCFMGRFCAWETAWYLLHVRPGKAFRRLRAGEDGLESSLGSGPRIRVFYPSIRALAVAFREEFDLVSFRSIGVLVPPSYMESWAGVRRGIVRRLASLDERVNRWPVLRAAGDHRLVIFVRKA